MLFRIIVGIGLALLLSIGESQGQVIVPIEQDAFYVRLAGRILGRSLGKPVSYATIVNKTSKKGVVSDSSGYFTIVLSNKDTLEIRHVGYKTIFYCKPPSRNTNYYEDILLTENAFELKEVTIYRKRQPLRSIALNPDYERYDIFKLNLFGAGKPRLNERAGIGSPITALYESYSRRAQNLRKLEKLKEDKALVELAAIRYNPYYVESLTGLKGQDLDAFMGYCPLNTHLIISATDYELAVHVLNCYRRFMNDL